MYMSCGYFYLWKGNIYLGYNPEYFSLGISTIQYNGNYFWVILRCTEQIAIFTHYIYNKIIYC